VKGSVDQYDGSTVGVALEGICYKIVSGTARLAG